MTRSGYVDDYEYMNLYRASVERSLRGKRGQSFLIDMAKAFDAMHEKVLIANELVNEDGQACAIGVVCQARGIDTTKIDYTDQKCVGDAVGISRCMAAEIEFMNDEWSPTDTPQQRWERMRKWVQEKIIGGQP